MKLLKWMTVTTLFLFPVAFAAETLDPIVNLYTQRVELAKVEVEKQQAVAENAVSRLQRLRRLLQSNAVSREEYEAGVMEARVAQANVTVSQIEVKEAEAMLELAKVRSEAGLDMPVCRD